MKTKSVNKLKLSKEVVVLLNEQQNNINGGAVTTIVSWGNPTKATLCFICDKVVVKG